MNQWLVWEKFHCMGCNPHEPHYADHKTKTIWLCKSFVESLYLSVSATAAKDQDKKLKNPTERFDKCGFLEDKASYSRDEEGNVVETADGKRIVYPSRKYKNVYAMLDDPGLKPAFYKDYIFRVDMENIYKRVKEDTNPYSWKCFSGANSLIAATFTGMYITLLI